MNELGTLQPVELRTVWKDEARDFTPWLATEENIGILGRTLGMELEVEDMEVSVGPFSADIVCRDLSDDSIVVIENQIGPTDHSHMGQLLTYAAGLGAKKLIWLSARFRDEHRAVLDWLNEHTAEEICCFGLEIELWRIGNSPPAPKFNIVSKPNDWSKTVKSNATGSANISAHKKLQLEFWTAMKAWGDGNGRIALSKPAPQHWNSISSGRSGLHYSLITSYWNSLTNTKGSEIRVDLVMTSRHSKVHFERLKAMATELQSQLDLPLHWSSQENVQMCRVFVRRDADFADRSQWKEQFDWMATYFAKFRQLFGPLIRDL
ncbi:MAG: DUF4268 domain-containing protein [Flavobacteriales bacterium]|nr:DUF4268 domain-containing protein [Flavobacteriales bacterium]